MIILRDGVPCDSMLNFLLKSNLFTLVISLTGFEQKTMSNLFVTNLSDIRDREGKILKKQLKLICLLSMR